MRIEKKTAVGQHADNSASLTTAQMPVVSLIQKAVARELKVPSLTTLTANNALIRKDRANLDQGLKRKLKAIEKKLACLLPMETEAREDLKQQMRSLKSERVSKSRGLGKIQSVSEYKKAEALKEQGYTPLDWRDFLSWKNKQKLPALFLFDVASSKPVGVQFSARWERSKQALIFDSVQVVLGGPNKFIEALNKLYKKSFGQQFLTVLKEKNSNSMEITATFSGVIPEKVRKIIRQEHASRKWEKIYLVTEVKKWEQRAQIDKDPIVVGLVGDFLFHITDFDLTTLEEHAAFSVDDRINRKKGKK